MFWSKFVKIMAFVFAAVLIIGSLIGAAIVGFSVADGGFVAFLGLFILGTVVSIASIAVIMMFVEAAENIYSINQKLDKLIKKEPSYTPNYQYDSKPTKVSPTSTEVVKELANQLAERDTGPGECKCAHCGNIQSSNIKRCLKCGELIGYEMPNEFSPSNY